MWKFESVPPTTNCCLTDNGKILYLTVAECCYEDSPSNVLNRPDLKITKDPKYLLCDKCGRYWEKVICYIGADLQVSHDWIPVPFCWEK